MPALERAFSRSGTRLHRHAHVSYWPVAWADAMLQEARENDQNADIIATFLPLRSRYSATC